MGKSDVKVKVQKITSINDPETGQPGKQIELVEVRQRSSQPTLFGAGEEEAKVVRGILGQFQSMGIFPQVGQLVLPKMTLFLSEDEYDLLGVRFEVNDIYEMIMKDGSVTLRRSAEGV